MFPPIIPILFPPFSPISPMYVGRRYGTDYKPFAPASRPYGDRAEYVRADEVEQ